MRLDRALSKLGIASRSEAKQLIASGRVRVGGRVVTDPARLVPDEAASITLDREPPQRRTWRTIAMNKPRGVVTTRRDPQGRRTVFDVLGEAGRGLVAVGRLDMASTGLLLLTNDTQLANRLTDPAEAVVRRYVVTVRGAVDDAAPRQMVKGIDGLAAKSVAIRKRSSRETHLLVELVEGKNREIRRMFAALGHEVTRLMRVMFGPIELGTLQPGQWRALARDAFSGGAGQQAGEYNDLDETHSFDDAARGSRRRVQ
jgi:23S rRNA pseudouridine2605 synthase